jgi:hypothetical protein
MKGNNKISSKKKDSNYNNEITINDKNNLKKNETPNIKEKEIVKSSFRSSKRVDPFVRSGYRLIMVRRFAE